MHTALLAWGGGAGPQTPARMDAVSIVLLSSARLL